jgi:3'-phosphoadenosine 5'-phosphosulfate (PAPS) 3'-phosphatase
MWIGEQGQGSYEVLPDGSLSKLSAVGSGPLKAWTSPTLASEDQFLDKLKIIDRAMSYSASLKIMHLAGGHGDLYPNFRKKCSLWDLVAPLVILQEAGGDLVFEQYPSLPVNFVNPHINSKFYAVGPRMAGKNYFTED